MTALDRNLRFSIMAQAGDEAQSLLPLAERVLEGPGGEVAVLTPPRVGMLMLRMREPVDGSIFNAGEVLVTEAQIALGEHQGYALRLGRAPDVTLAAAILDAAVEANHPLTATILDELATLAAIAETRQRDTWAAIAPTRVAFDEMR